MRVLCESESVGIWPVCTWGGPNGLTADAPAAEHTVQLEYRNAICLQFYLRPERGEEEVRR